MSRPILLATLSLALGIIVADTLFYESYSVPVWLDLAAWGCCLLVALLAASVYPRSARKAEGRSFIVLTAVFFAVVGFVRYAAYADEVQAQWQQLERPPVNRGNPDEFDYRRWRWLTQSSADSSSVLSNLRHRALEVRDRLSARYARAGLDDEALAVVTAITLGDRSQLQRETRDLYASAGVSHLLALSGLHLGIIVGMFLTWLNGWLLCSRWRVWVGVLVILFIWTYAFVAGLSTSLVRASLMTSLFVIASLMQRNGSALNLVVLTAFVMLMVRPVYLFDVGAQLSFAAVVGIITLHGRWVRWAYGRWRFQCFWLARYHLMWPLELLSVSLAAQLATLPLVAFYFHRFSLYAPLFNLVLIPLTMVLVYGALVLLLVSAVLPALSGALAMGLTWVVTAQLALMRWEVSWPGAVVDDFWSRKAEPQVVVYHNRRCPALHVIAAPERSWLLTPMPDSVEVGMKYIAESFWRRRLTATPVVLRGQMAVAVKGARSAFQAVMIGEGSGDEGWQDGGSDKVAAYTTRGEKEAETRLKGAAETRLKGAAETRLKGAAETRLKGAVLPVACKEVDVLWLVRGFRGGRLGWLTDAYRPKLVVLDASLPRWQRAALAEEARRVGWRIYDVAEQGAMRVSLGE